MNANEANIQNQLEDAILNHMEDEHSGVDVISFEQAGVLNSNAGLVLKLKSGEEFQLTIIQSK